MLLIENMKLCFIDVETTGLNPKRNGIIQIAGIIDIDDTQVLDFNFYVKPFSSDIIDKKSLEINKISLKRIRTFHKPQEIYNKLIHIFTQYIDKYDKSDKFIFAGYNANFDFQFLNEFFKKNNDQYFFSWFFSPPLDIMNLALFDLKNNLHRIKNFQLETVLKYYNINPGVSHNAFEDIKATYKLYREIYSKYSSF